MSGSKIKTNPLAAESSRHPIASSSGNELIPIFIENNQEVVDARSLWNYLGVSQEFANWIKKRISEYGFAESLDYWRFDKVIKTTGGRRTEYTITLDMAKELAMVERNERGRRVRQYFIACERKLRVINAHEAAIIEQHRKRIAAFNSCPGVVRVGNMAWYPISALLRSLGKSTRAGTHLARRNPEQCTAIALPGKRPQWYASATLAARIAGAERSLAV